MHAQCYKWFQLLHSHYLQNCGLREPEHTILANLLSPHIGHPLEAERRKEYFPLEAPEENSIYESLILT